MRDPRNLGRNVCLEDLASPHLEDGRFYWFGDHRAAILDNSVRHGIRILAGHRCFIK